MKYANVTFAGGNRKYSYMTELENLVPGDSVEVETKRGNQVATFVEYTEFTAIATKRILGLY